MAQPPEDSGQVQFPSSPRCYGTLCKTVARPNQPHTVLHLNQPHITTGKARHGRVFPVSRPAHFRNANPQRLLTNRNRYGKMKTGWRALGAHDAIPYGTPGFVSTPFRRRDGRNGDAYDNESYENL